MSTGRNKPGFEQFRCVVYKGSQRCGLCVGCAALCQTLYDVHAREPADNKTERARAVIKATGLSKTAGFDYMARIDRGERIAWKPSNKPGVKKGAYRCGKCGARKALGHWKVCVNRPDSEYRDNHPRAGALTGKFATLNGATPCDRCGLRGPHECIPDSAVEFAKLRKEVV